MAPYSLCDHFPIVSITVMKWGYKRSPLPSSSLSSSLLSYSNFPEACLFRPRLVLSLCSVKLFLHHRSYDFLPVFGCLHAHSCFYVSRDVAELHSSTMTYICGLHIYIWYILLKDSLRHTVSHCTHIYSNKKPVFEKALRSFTSESPALKGLLKY